MRDNPISLSFIFLISKFRILRIATHKLNVGMKEECNCITLYIAHTKKSMAAAATTQQQAAGEPTFTGLLRLRHVFTHVNCDSGKPLHMLIPCFLTVSYDSSYFIISTLQMRKLGPRDIS